MDRRRQEVCFKKSVEEGAVKRVECAEGLDSGVCGVLFLFGLFCACVFVSPAFAGSAWWGLTSGSWPSNLPPGGTGKVIVTAQNRGYADAEGECHADRGEDMLPEGLKAKSAEGFAGEEPGAVHYLWCLGVKWCVRLKRACCRGSGLVPPFEQIEVRITVEVSETASGRKKTWSV